MSPKKKNKTFEEGEFRACRTKYGLTYSNPTDNLGKPHPIKDCETIAEFLISKGGPGDYVVTEELHKNGDHHFHAYIKYVSEYDVKNPRMFDLSGVHPNLLNPGKGWLYYLTNEDKDGHVRYVTNFFKKDPYQVALSCETAAEAVESLWANVPSDMCKQGHNIISNVTRRMRTVLPETIYPGPYPKEFFPEAWTPKTHSLLIYGPVGTHKTQYAKYLLHHLYGGCNYVKGTLKSLKDADFSLPILFDEIDFREEDPALSKEITDVENGGCIKQRWSDIFIPSGIPRIFLHNYEHIFRNPDKAVYDRRVQVFKWPI